jgi:hypothetical protein
LKKFNASYHGGKATSVNAIPDSSFTLSTINKLATDICVLHEFKQPYHNVTAVKENMKLNLATNLTTLLNSWLSNRSIPAPHATARMVFLYKSALSPEGNSIDELRPIAVLSILLKILEIVIFRRIKLNIRNGTITRLHPS